MLDRETGEVVEHTLSHDGETVREFYAAIPKPAVVGIEATGSMNGAFGVIRVASKTAMAFCAFARVTGAGWPGNAASNAAAYPIDVSEASTPPRPTVWQELQLIAMSRYLTICVQRSARRRRCWRLLKPRSRNSDTWR